MKKHQELNQEFDLNKLTLFATGRAYKPPLPRICVFLYNYMYEWVDKTWLFSIISLEKGNMLLTPYNYLVLQKRIKVVGNTRNS